MHVNTTRLVLMTQDARINRNGEAKGTSRDKGRRAGQENDKETEQRKIGTQERERQRVRSCLISGVEMK